MAEQVLSQDEVDALLTGIATEQVSTGEASELPEYVRPAAGRVPAAALGEVKSYDFSTSENAARGRLPGLEVIFSNFARRLQNIFATELGKSVDANFDGMDVLSYEHLIQSFPLPASIHAVRLEPLRGIGVMVIEARLAFAMVELFFGGAGQKAMKVEGRDFTPIESRFLGKFVERMLIGMEECWQPITAVKGRYLRSEMNPYLLNAASMGDAMVMAPYSINMSPISGSILFALPMAALEELRGKLKTGIVMGEDRQSGGIFERLQDPLLDIELEAQAVVDIISMSVGEIMRMRAGDVIQLNSSGLHEVRLAIEGVPKFIGKAAERSGNKVFVTRQRID
jgi:flagellar motor switch protein FliM